VLETAASPFDWSELDLFIGVEMVPRQLSPVLLVSRFVKLFFALFEEEISVAVNNPVVLFFFELEVDACSLYKQSPIHVGNVLVCFDKVVGGEVFEP
jgi:hypothetical protein